jgi:membrane protein YqaA with SNARE-associated domain
LHTNQTEAVSKLDKLKNILQRWEFWVSILTVGFTISLALLVVFYWESFQEMAGYSYLGMFFISIIGGATVIIPVPSLALQFTMGAVLHPAIVGAVAGLGTGIGGTVIYLFGRSGRRLFFNTDLSIQKYDNFITRWFSRLRGWTQRRGSLTVFFMSAALNPVFFPMALALGASRFRMWRFFVMCWAGNTVKSMIIAYLGYFGLGSLLRSIGIEV